jgi:hypothetical protein
VRGALLIAIAAATALAFVLGIATHRSVSSRSRSDGGPLHASKSREPHDVHYVDSARRRATAL